MSAINQMLRDLDARNATQAPPIVRETLAGERPRRPDKPRGRPLGWLGLAAVGVAIVGGYLTLRGAPPERGATGAAVPHPARVAARTSGVPFPHPSLPPSVTAAMPVLAPIVRVRTPPAVSSSHQAPADLPATVPHKIASAVAALKEGRPLKLPSLPPVRPDPSETTVPKVAEVIKRPVELSPAAAAQQLVDEAHALRREGRPDAARRKYRDALERNPDLSSARIALGEIMSEQGEAEAAFDLLKTAYNQQPEADLAVALGRMSANRGQRSEALTWFARGNVALRPAEQALTAALFAQEQRYAEAIRAYQAALAVEPHQGGWLLGLGLALEATGQRELAQASYRQALVWGEFKPEVIKFLNQRSGVAP